MSTFGEVAFLDGRPRAVTVTATSDAEVLRLGHEAFLALSVAKVFLTRWFNSLSSSRCSSSACLRSVRSRLAPAIATGLRSAPSPSNSTRPQALSQRQLPSSCFTRYSTS